MNKYHRGSTAGSGQVAVVFDTSVAPILISVSVSVPI